MKKIILLFALFINSFLFSQRGKDGAATIAAGSTIVNVYSALNANASAGSPTINILSATGYSVGDLVYVIQMQGAAVNCFTNAFGNPNSPEPYSPAFGRITSYNSSGRNEYGQIASISGNTITLDCPLKYTYLSTGKAQVLRVPRYTALTITGTITCPPWNGSTGGVVAIEVLGATTINASGRIDVSGLGFRGGLSPTVKTHAAVFGGASWGNISKLEGGLKGESIAGDTTLYGALFNGKYCKGAVANGGGGGNSNNAGGGGGANAGDTSLYLGTGNPDNSVAGYSTAWNLEPGFSSGSTSSGGGRGGYTFSNNNGSPLVLAPGNVTWSGDSRRVQGGMGGRPLDYAGGRLFLGGGGGAGDENDSYGSSGGDGGGLINIISYGVISGSGQILADGENGFNTRTTGTPAINDANGRDGAGGGGGGGAIVINSAGTINTITLSAKGGLGGNNQMKSNYTAFGPTAMAYGPGGGGGGGYIGTTTTAGVVTAVNGGANGTVSYIPLGSENCQIDNLFPPNGATIGGSGKATGTLAALPTITATASNTICVNSTFTAVASTTGPGTIGWYTQTAGGTLLASGAAFTSSIMSTPGTYTVYAGFCPDGLYRAPTIITVLTSPTVVAASQTICSGQSATVTASGATNYLWNTGAPTASIAVSPTTTTVYTVTGSNGTCSSSATASVIVNSAGTITVNSATICNGQSATLTAGAASSYTWSNAANTVSISVNPTVTTTYTVNATSAGCVLTNTASVIVNTNPTVSIASATICSGQTTTLTASGAGTYTWNTGANTASIPVTPSVSTSYTVTGANGNCTNIKTATVTVNTTPTVSVNSSTICSGNSATLSASGATTYSWNTGAVTSAINPSPSATTVYTITGTSNNCTDVKTSTVTVNTTPTVSVNSSTICSGNSATVTASGAISYSWNTGAVTSVINPSPVVTTVYTITGTSNNCTDVKTSTVTVNTTPTVSVNSSTICSGNSATLTASGATNYSWNTGAITGVINPSPAATTVYTITGTSNNCSDVKTSTVTVNTTPTLSVNSSTICSGNSATLTASGATTYSWSTGAITTVINPSPVATTVYTITGSSNNCTDIKTSTVTVNTTPTVSVNSSTICSGNSATLTANGASTYTWSTGSNSVSITQSPTSTTIYTVTGSSNNCNNVKTATISVNPTPTVSVNSTTTCSGASTTLTASGAASYTWNTGSTLASIVVSPTVNTTYTVTGANGTCSSTAVSTIVVSPVGSIAVNSSTICSGQSATLTAGAASSYTWSAGGNASSIVVTPTINSTYTINATSGGGCPLTNTASVIVNSNPTISVAGATLCSGQTTTLLASGATTYTWNTGPTTANISVNPAATTVYTVSGSTGNCISNKSATVTVNITPTVTVNSSTICSGSSATLIASGAGTYSWNTGALTAIINPSPAATTVYTITGTSNNCTDIKTSTVTVNTTPTLSVNSSTICSGNTATLTASGATNYSWSTGSNANSIQPSPAATTVYTVTGSSNNCNDIKTATITVNTTPTISVNSNTICSGSSASLMASGATTYTWSTGSNSNTIQPSPNVTTVYTVTGSSNNCTDLKTSTVTVNTTPTVSVNSATTCAGNSATLTASGAASYSWSTGSSSSSVIVSPGVTTSYTVTGLNASCSNSATATVVISTTGVISINSASICTGQTATLSAGAASSYTWNNGASTSAINVSPLATTVYTLNATSGGCLLSNTATVTVNTNPTVTVNSSTICSGSSATLTGNGATTYSWSTGATSNAIVLSPSATAVYTLTGSNGNCTNINTATISVNNTPTVSVNSTSLCSGNSVTLTASGAGTYSWNTGAVSPAIIVNPTTTSVYTITGTNANCSGVNTATVSVFSIPTLSLNASTFNICASQSASIIAGSSASTYSWSTGASTNSIVTSLAGVYDVTVTNGCGSASQSATVVSGAAPSFTINTTSTLVCNSQSVSLNTSGSSGTFTWSTGAVTPTISVNVSGVYSATLSNSCGIATNTINIISDVTPNIGLTSSAATICAGGNVTLSASGTGSLAWGSSTITSSQLTVTNTGIYSATLTNQCGSSTSSINITNGPPPSINILLSGSSCSGQTATLNASGASSYTWNTGATGPVLTTTTGGIYNAVGTNSCGSGTNTFNVVFSLPPSVNVTATQYTICPNQTTTLTALGLNGSNQYSWFNFPSNTSNVQTVSSGGNYLVTYTNSCGTSTAMVSIIQSTVNAGFSFSPSGGVAPVTVGFTNSSFNYTLSQWNFGNGQTSSNTNEGGITYQSAGIYTVSLLVQNSDGCTSVTTQTLEILPLEFGPIPEVLTPNGDSRNDIFQINGIERYPSNELQIYNRWGNLVYSMKGYNNSNGWDGKPNASGKSGSNKLPTGTYYYLLILNDGSEQAYRGFVELMY